MTVDVEDWVNATVLQLTGKVTPPTDAVLRQSETLLEILAEHEARATWFFLGEVAAHFPRLVKRVADAGHELGIHGFHHHQVPALSPDEYRESIRRAKQCVEQISGKDVIGYRAVDFSINRNTWWALDTLVELGFKYDSSVFPMKTPRYGVARAERSAHWITTEAGARVFEVPVSVFSLAGIRFPFAGGGYFRLLPYRVVELMMRREIRRGPVVFYMHPCEIEQATELGSLPDSLSEDEKAAVSRCFKRQKKGREKGREKLGRLLSRHRFGSVVDVFGEEFTCP
jgi:polysaccharide deacetylase family protein (PEP-CTERM system associated)